MRFLYIAVAGSITVLAGFCVSAIAGDGKSTITGYFEGGAVLGEFAYKNSADGMGLVISYYSPSLNKTLTYKVAKYDECSVMSMYRMRNTRQVVIDGSCASQGGQIYKYVYEWSGATKNWCLVREITGERADFYLGTVVSSEHVFRVKNCVIPGADEPYSYESDTEVARGIAVEIKKFRDSMSSNEILKRYLDSIPSYSIYEMAGYVNSDNVRDVNDLAFYLSENGRSYDALPLLERIVQEFPGRMVAKLNLADAYWDSDFKEQGALFYRQYYNEMVSSKLGKKVSDRVLGRMKKY
ncbi:tetratricopeptide repeat protein [Burkholderia ubonensis]|uniref:tetratricopeptide repeat protein n=1 Tax=Burkholderia ubonensis TaxID=101571 RepID=UPI000AA4AD72|nr:tetratricopeptide repeat protein [Burkholderia ubonensis]